MVNVALLRKRRLIRKMREAGIEISRIAYEEAKRAGLELAVLCAVLEQETGGGRNVWGHDAGSDGKRIGPRLGGWNMDEGNAEVGHGNGAVSETAYKVYRRWRDRAGTPPYGRMQGVGPMQLTWYTYQNLADKYGGCWNPRFNVRAGAEILSGAIKRRNLHQALWSYNGSESYAFEVERRVEKWRRILA